MKRLLFLDHTPFAGGAQLVLAEHFAAIDKTKFEVHIACTDQAPQLLERYSQAGATVHLLQLPHLKRLNPIVLWHFWQSIAQVRQLIKQLQVDLVISNTARTAYIASVAVIGTNVPLIWWVRDVLYNQLLFRTLGRIPKKIICVSQAIRQAYLPDNDRRGVVVYVASSLYQKLAAITAKQVRQERKIWGFAEEDVVVGMMGRLVAEKGPEDVVEACQRLFDRFSQLKLLLVGTGRGQAHSVEETLRRQIDEQGLADRIVLAGYQTNEALFYSLFDIFILATRDFEAFATTVVQAMMAGKVVIATDNGGTPELVHDGETGLLVPPGDPVALAAAITKLIQNPALRERLAKAGQDRVLQYHREEIATAQLEALYEDTLKSSIG